MVKHKLWKSWVLLIVLSTALVACSKDLENVIVEEDEILFQETMSYGTKGESTTLDPARITESDSLKVTVNIFETLLMFNEQDQLVEPGLAKKWNVSKDELTYTLVLREGVKFHDDTDFNAEAVVKNFDRWADGDMEKFPHYGLAFDGYKKDEKHNIESVTADKKNTVVIKLKSPKPKFLELLASEMLAIASPTAFEELGDEEFEVNPVGTGPFRFIEWKPDDSITIARFADYHQEGIPKLSKVIFIAIPNSTARLNALLAGDLDLADELSPDDIGILEANDSFQLFERPLTTPKELVGGVERLSGYYPDSTGKDLLSTVEIKMPIEE